MAHNNDVLDDSDNTTNDSISNGQNQQQQKQYVKSNKTNGHIKIQNYHLPIANIDVHKGEPVRLQVKVAVPIEDHPNYNFVGKLLGPKGNSLKWLQERTQTKMAILGKGSMKNKQKEEELRRAKNPKFSHLNENLHVEITAVAPAPEAYLRISNALFEIKRFLVPDYFDEIRQQQLRELGVIPDDSIKIDQKPLVTDHIKKIGNDTVFQYNANNANNNNNKNVHISSDGIRMLSLPSNNLQPSISLKMKDHQEMENINHKCNVSGTLNKSKLYHGHKLNLVTRVKPYYKQISYPSF